MRGLSGSIWSMLGERRTTMALKFQCDHCGGDIIVRFLKVGEMAECKNCQTQNIVPESAQSIEDSSIIGQPILNKKETEGVLQEANEESRKSKSRSWISIISLSIIFLWLILWFWMLLSGQIGLAYALDISNPSPLGILAFICIIVFICNSIIGKYR